MEIPALGSWAAGQWKGRGHLTVPRLGSELDNFTTNCWVGRSISSCPRPAFPMSYFEACPLDWLIMRKLFRF